MRKIKEILRLHFELQLGQRDIARAAQVSQSTVHSYIARATAAALPWPLPENWSDDRLRAALFPSPKPQRRGQDRPQPDFAHIEAQQQQHAELTLELLWEEPLHFLCRLWFVNSLEYITELWVLRWRTTWFSLMAMTQRFSSMGKRVHRWCN